MTDTTTIKRAAASSLGIQYAHAIHSSVTIADGPGSSTIDHHHHDDHDDIVIPQLLNVDFDAERRIIEKIELEIAERQSELEALLAQLDRDIEAKEKRRKEECARKVAAELAARKAEKAALAAKKQHEKDEAKRQAAEAERERMRWERDLAEAERLRRDKNQKVLDDVKKLDADKQSKFQQFAVIVGDSSDASTRKAFLDSLNWDLETAIAAFFEYEGVAENMPSELLPPSPVAKAVIEFQFPDNSVESAQFNADDTLWIVFQWVFAKVQKFSTRGFSLSCPGRPVFDEAEFDKSLQELNLFPRGRIVVNVE